MSRLSEEDEELLFKAREALTAIERDGKRLRARVDLIWRAIAADLLNNMDTARWARRVAKEVVDEVMLTSPEDRPKRALRALNIIGVEDKNLKESDALKRIFDAEKHLNMLGRLRGFLKDGQSVNLTGLEIIERMRAEGFYSRISDSNALKRLDRLREKFPQNS